MKRILRNKVFRRVSAFITALVVTISGFTFAPNIVKADWVSTDELHTEVYIAGTKVAEDGSALSGTESFIVHEGDDFKVEVNWDLFNGDRGSSLGREIVLSDTRNVSIPTTENIDLYSGSDKIGTASIINDGQLKMKLDVTDPIFLSAKNDRRVHGVINGKISNNESVEDRDNLTIQAGEVLASTTVIFDDGSKASSLNVSKSSSKSKLTWDSVNSKWIQEYTIKLEAKDGKVTGIKLTDVAGSNLSNMSSISVASVSGDVKDSSDAAISGSSTFATVADLNGANGLTMQKDSVVELTYTMEVSDAAFDSSASYDSKKNTLKANYKNSKKENKETPETSYTIENYVKPYVQKSVSASSTDAEQVWTIKLYAGDMMKKDSSLKLGDVFKKLEDTLPTGIEMKEPATSPFPMTFTPGETPVGFVDEGNGVWRYEYKTKVDDAHLAVESFPAKNTATVTDINDRTPDAASATYTTKGSDPDPVGIAKAPVGDIDAGVITWSVDITNIKPTYTAVKVSDWISSEGSLATGKSYGAHTLNKEVKLTHGPAGSETTVTIVDADGNITSDGADIVSYYNYYGSSEITLKDTFIASNAGNKLTFTYKTTVTDSNTKNKVYQNTGFVGYKNASGVYKDDKAAANYEKAFTPVTNVIDKNGVANDDTDTIEYTLTLDMDELKTIADAEGDKNFVITDTLPTGMAYDDTYTVVVKDIYRNSWGGEGDILVEEKAFYKEADGTYEYRWGSDNDGYIRITDAAVKPSIVGTSYDSSTNKLTFTIPQTKKNIGIVNGFVTTNKGGSNRKVKITYRAKIADDYKETFGNKKSAQTFINTADGTYGDTGVNTTPATATNTLTPKGQLTKTGVVDLFDFDGLKINAAKYVVDVNPDAIDMDASDTLTGVDTLGSALSYYLDSIKVYELAAGVIPTLADGSANQAVLDAGKLLVAGTDYKWVYDMNNNTLTFKLPDAKHLALTYSALANIYAGQKTGETAVGSLTEANSTNSFKLAANKIEGGNSQDKKSFSVSAYTYEYWATSTTGNIYLKKYAMVSDVMTPVKGTKFELYTTSGDGPTFTRGTLKSTYTVTADDGKLKIDDLEFNKVYELVETEPGSYVDGSGNTVPTKLNTESYYFIIPGSENLPSSLDVSNVHLTGFGNTIYYKNESNEEKTIDISKKAVGSGSELEGAKLSIYKKSDCTSGVPSSTATAVATWTSGTTAKTIVIGTEAGKIAPGEYVLVEDGAPAGYAYTESIEFKIAEDGTVTSPVTTAVSGTTVTMRDKLISDIKISKVSVTGTTATELAGASMKLYEGKTATGAPTGTLVDSWTSGTTVHEIAGAKLKADQEYTLYEEIAPDGYKVATNITFKIGKDGKVTEISTNAYTTSDAANGLIVMEDEAIPVIPEEKKVTLSKKAVGGSAELPGAKLSIYKKSDCTSGVPSSTATAVATWTSGTTAKTIVIGTEAGKIAPGEYVLVEDGAPAGYAYTESIEFKIAEDGTVTSPVRVATIIE